MMFSKARRFNAGKAKPLDDKENMVDKENKETTLKNVDPKTASAETKKTISKTPKLKAELSKTKPYIPKLKSEQAKSKTEILPTKASTKTKENIKVKSEDLKGKPDLLKIKSKTTLSVTPRVKTNVGSTTKSLADAQSQCSSLKKVFFTPKHLKPVLKTPSSLRTPLSCKKNINNTNNFDKKVIEDILKSQEVEIRNKNETIADYGRQIEEFKYEISQLQKQVQNIPESSFDLLKTKTEVTLDDNEDALKSFQMINELKGVIATLEQQCTRLEQELCSKQVELSSLEEIICIRDSLCKDLQNKLTNVETGLEETKQRLEMVKGHHALALEANESIRREYKAELETVKAKVEEEKQVIINKSKADQENLKSKYINQIEAIKKQLTEEKENLAAELQHEIEVKEIEMKAKLEQIDEATNEKLKLCEIQFEERFRSIQEHWNMQEDKIKFMEKQTSELTYSLTVAEEHKAMLQREINSLINNNETILQEKENLTKEVNELKNESKIKFIEFENQINKLTVEVDKALKEKHKYELSLSVTRDIVQVLTMRLRESDNDVEHLEGQVQALSEAKEALEQELSDYKKIFDNTLHECNEYKEALMNIMKSKSALAREHNRIMEHNVSLIDCLQNVEKEAFRELGSIKNELIEDVEMLRQESKSQIQQLQDEVEAKRILCEQATEHAGEVAAAAEQSRQLIELAAAEITRLETDNQRLLHQIQDQQSIVVELSLLRQENEELAITVAKQNSIIEKMKKDMLEQAKEQAKPKSPSVLRKAHKVGKENTQLIISPLRERNH